MSTHTPGKWFYEPCPYTVKRYTDHEKGIYETADGERIAASLQACEGLDDPSAVPDLLAACRKSAEAIRAKLFTVNNKSTELLLAALDAAEAAIHKAILPA